MKTLITFSLLFVTMSVTYGQIELRTVHRIEDSSGRILETHYSEDCKTYISIECSKGSHTKPESFYSINEVVVLKDQYEKILCSEDGCFYNGKEIGISSSIEEVLNKLPKYRLVSTLTNKKGRFSNEVNEYLLERKVK